MGPSSPSAAGPGRWSRPVTSSCSVFVATPSSSRPTAPAASSPECVLPRRASLVGEWAVSSTGSWRGRRQGGRAPAAWAGLPTGTRGAELPLSRPRSCLECDAVRDTVRPCPCDVQSSASYVGVPAGLLCLRRRLAGGVLPDRGGRECAGLRRRPAPERGGGALAVLFRCAMLVCAGLAICSELSALISPRTSRRVPEVGAGEEGQIFANTKQRKAQ